MVESSLRSPSMHNATASKIPKLSVVSTFFRLIALLQGQPFKLMQSSLPSTPRLRGILRKLHVTHGIQ